MKRFLLSGLMLLSLGSAFAQTAGKQALYLYDDFATATEYSGTGGQQPSNPDGMYWFPQAAASDPNYVVSRPGDGKLHVAVTNATNFVPFGLTFGDDNGAAAGGNPFIQNFGSPTTGNMNFSFTIQNQNQTANDSAWVTIQIEDSLGNSAEFMPDESAVSSSWSASPLVRKQKIGVLVLPGATQTVNINLSNVSGKVGGLHADPAYPCSTPMDCPNTTYDINPHKIAKILFFVNGDASLVTANRVYPNISSYNGTLLISNFKVGNATTTGVTSSSNIATSSLYPNPTSDVANVSLDLKAAADVKVVLNDMLGNQVDVINAGTTASVKTSFNVSKLAKGAYTVNYIINGESAKTELLLVK